MGDENKMKNPPSETRERPTIDSHYASSVEMLNHFSTMRTIVISFMSPAILSVTGLAISNFDKPRLVLYLSLFQALMACYLAYSSRYFAKRIQDIRQHCARLESGTYGDETLFRIIANQDKSSVHFWRILSKTDNFDNIIRWSIIFLEAVYILFIVENYSRFRLFVYS